jgi:outer membrane protein, heavy metal efflux system
VEWTWKADEGWEGMLSRSYRRGVVLGFVLLAAWHPRAGAQAPTIEENGILLKGLSLSTPGSMSSLLGPMPGSSGITFGMQPGRDDMILGKIGLGAPRVPISITTPGGVYQGPPRSQGIAAPRPIPVPPPLRYGTMELPKEEDQGPPDGLAIDQAIELLLQGNLDLRAKFQEIPQMRADELTASLRANPIFYADSQLVPYGSNSVRRPDGPTQYDVNFSYPLDISHKRQARMALASRALKVTEAQYQDAVRLAIGNLYGAFVDVLAAREDIRALRVSVRGLDEIVRIHQELYEKLGGTSADVDQAKADREIGAVGLMDAQEVLLKRKRVLGEILNLTPDQAERLELRGRLSEPGPRAPAVAELIQIAQDSRPDLASYRLGVETAFANVKLQLANRFSDAYLLVQPYTFQNNAPFGKQSGASWAMGITVPVPLYNRNQGNIDRARINVTQSQQQLAYLERRLATEVQQAVGEYVVSGRIVERIRDQVLPGLKRTYETRLELFREGEVSKVVFMETQRKYNDTVKAYLDSEARHRRSMFDLNTVVGQRILP